MRPLFLRSIYAVPLLGCGVFVFVLALWLAGYFQSAELWIYDRLVSWRAGAGTTDPRIELVLLKETDIRRYDYPLRDSKLTELLQIIEQDGPRAIGLDLYRDLAQPRNGSELRQLEQVLAGDPNLITIFLYNDPNDPARAARYENGLDSHFAVAPPKILAEARDRIGCNNFPADDRTVRRGYIYTNLDPSKHEEYGSLSWQLALRYLEPLGIGPTSDGSSVRLGKSTFPKFSENEGGYIWAASSDYQFLLDYKGPQKFSSQSVDEVLTGHAKGKFKDKIVLIGGDSDSAGDFYITPLGQNLQEPGVVIHAQAVNQFLRAALDGDAPTRGVGLGWQIVLLAAWCAVAAAIGYYCHSFWTFVGMLVLSLGVLAGFTTLMFFQSIWFASAAPALAIALTAIGVKAYTAQVEARNRVDLMQLFSRHVSGDVAKTIWENRDQVARPQKLTATVLFTDLKNYSTISEALPPDQLMSWINECLGSLARHVDRNGGVINKYIGDSIMAVFGVPAARTKQEEIRADALHAVQCAWDMKNELKRLNDAWQARGLSRVGLRIGIYTGELMAGTVGHEERLEYTVIGDSVNTASRLESVEKDTVKGDDPECRILIGEPTVELVKEKFKVELMGTTQLKGQKRMSPFYQVIGPVTES